MISLIELKKRHNLNDFFKYLNSDTEDNWITFLNEFFGDLNNYTSQYISDNVNYTDLNGEIAFSLRVSGYHKVHIDVFTSGEKRPTMRAYINEFGNVFKKRYYRIGSWDKVKDVYLDNNFNPIAEVSYDSEVEFHRYNSDGLIIDSREVNSESKLVHTLYLEMLEEHLTHWLETEPFVSVIIPSYNSSQFIHSPLDSLLGQSLNKNFIEVLVADDNSNDNTISVLTNYKKKMSNLSIIAMETNYGAPAGPRNAALKQAKGKYVLFMDHDDFLNDETFERFATYALEWQSDIFEGRKKGVRGRHAPRSMHRFGNVEFADVFQHNMTNTLTPHKLYSRLFLSENGMKFTTDFINGDDLLFNMQAYSAAKKISILSDYDYYFVTNREDGSHTLASSSAWNKSVEDSLMKVKLGKRVIFNSSKSSEFKRLLFAKFISRVRSDTLRLTDPDEKLEKFVNGWQKQVIPYLSSGIRDAIDSSRTSWMIDSIVIGGIHQLLMVKKSLNRRIKADNISGSVNGLIYTIKNQQVNLSDEMSWSAVANQLYLGKKELRISVALNNSLIDFEGLSAKLIVVDRNTQDHTIVQGNLINSASNVYSFIIDFDRISVFNLEHTYAFYLNICFQNYTKDIRVQTNLGFNPYEDTSLNIVPYKTASDALIIGVAENDSKMADWLMKKNQQKN